MYRLYCTAQSAHHEGSASASYIPVTGFFLTEIQMNFNLCKILKIFAVANKPRFFWCSQFIFWWKSLGYSWYIILTFLLKNHMFLGYETYLFFHWLYWHPLVKPQHRASSPTYFLCSRFLIVFRRHYWLRLARLKLTLVFCSFTRCRFAEITDVSAALSRLCKVHASVDNIKL